MRRDRTVHELTPAVQRYRRRVLAMIDARFDALDALYNSTDEIAITKRATDRLREKIGAMR